MARRTQIEAVIRILKKKFTNLTAEEVLKLAWDIVDALEEEERMGD